MARGVVAAHGDCGVVVEHGGDGIVVVVGGGGEEGDFGPGFVVREIGFLARDGPVRRHAGLDFGGLGGGGLLVPLGEGGWGNGEAEFVVVV